MKRKGKGKDELTGKARLRAELVEMTAGMHGAGLVSADELAKTTLRMLGPDALPRAKVLEPHEIVAIRERARMSQAVFARVLDVTVSTLTKWERGEIKPRGPARRLLQIIRVKGVEAVFQA